MTVKITQFRWAGRWGHWKIKSDCEECDITHNILKSMMKKEFKGKSVKFEIKPWLDNWIYCILKRSWHAPIIIVDGKKFHQFSKKDPLVNRKKLAEYVLDKIEQ